MHVISFLILSLFVADCATNQVVSTDKKTYLALGDSYTIGERVAEKERWPVQLVKRLNDAGNKYSQPNIIARTGWRTDDLLSAMDKVCNEQYDLVSIQIGVNNQFQGGTLVQYEKDLRILCERSIVQCRTGVEGVFAVSIPDYGTTPFAKDWVDIISPTIDEWNAVFKEVCVEYKIPFYNITDISRQAPCDEALIASDDLHPSGKMYKLWVDRIMEERWQ